MKRLLSIVMIPILLALCAVTAYAEGEEAPAPSVPRIEITTELGNGKTLQKADGYVNARISITDIDGSVIGGDVLFKVRGNSTALSSIEKKSFTFKFDKKTAVLGMGKGKKWALLANCFDPTLLRNFAVFDFAREMGLPYTSDQRFAELWLDGEYRGCYAVYEPVQEGKERVDIDIESNGGKKDFLIEYEATRVEDDVTYLTVSGLRFALKEPEEPTSEQLAYVTDIVTDIINTLKAGSEDEIRAAVDVDSFAKFYLLNEFAKTNDFGYSSVFFFYKDGRLYAGPVWDYDLALGNLNAELNSSTAKAAAVSDGIMQTAKNLYRYLTDKQWFMNEVRDVYARNYFYIEDIGADGGLLDRLREQYSEAFDRNFTLWRVNRWWLNYQRKPLATYDENYALLKSWCAERHAWLAAYFGLEKQSYLLGDADNDGIVTVLDATRVQRYVAGYTMPDDFSESTADSDEDGAITVLDATVIQRHLASFDVAHPVGETISRITCDAKE